MLRITDITCEHQARPLAIATPHPRFSWKLESDEKDTIQIAYRIQVWTSENQLIWDSGRIEHRHTYDIVYEGTVLKSAERYIYQIQVWDPGWGLLFWLSRLSGTGRQF